MIFPPARQSESHSAPPDRSTRESGSAPTERGSARGRRKKVEERELGGFKYFRLLKPLLAHLREEAPHRNRVLHYDSLATLLLFHWFNPMLDSLRGLSAASEFPKVQRMLKVPRASLGALSESQNVFDPELMTQIIAELGAQVSERAAAQQLPELDLIPTIVDGTLLKALPRVAWALWLNDGKRAAKAHVQFEILKNVPTKAVITEGKGSERDALRSMLVAGRLYVLDQGYMQWALFQEIVDAGSSFVARVRDGTVFDVVEERDLTPDAREARVSRDVVVHLGERSTRNGLKRPVRLVEIRKVEQSSKRRRAERRLKGEPLPETILVATDRLDLPADVIAHLYASRWKIEIFFRWLKCILGCRRLILESREGVELQVYTAIIACLLINLWTGKKPTKRVFEAICFYLQGWAELDDVMNTVRRLKPTENSS